MDDALSARPDLIEANEANFCGYMRELARWTPGFDANDDPDVTVWFSGRPTPVYNGLAGVRLDAERAERELDQAMARAREAKAPIQCQVGPPTTPTDLADRLMARGFVVMRTIWAMSRPLDAADESFDLPPGVTVELVRDLEALYLYSRILAGGFEVPETVGDTALEFFSGVGVEQDSTMQSSIAWVDGEPAAIATVYAADGVAGLYNIATLPNARGRGAAGAATRAVMREGWARGGRLAILQATEMGYPMYERMGFVEDCEMVRYMWTPPGD